MSPKTGRPKSDNPKFFRIQVRIDKKTLELLDDCVKKGNSTRSDIVRRGISLVADEMKK